MAVVVDFFCAMENKIGPDAYRCKKHCPSCQKWYPLPPEITPEEHPCIQGKPCNCEGECQD